MLGQFDEAEKSLQRAIDIDGREADQFFSLGLARMGRGRFEKAESALRDAIAKRPKAQGYHCALGNLLERRGRLAQAREAFVWELAINPPQGLSSERIRGIERAMQVR